MGALKLTIRILFEYFFPGIILLFALLGPWIIAPTDASNDLFTLIFESSTESGYQDLLPLIFVAMTTTLGLLAYPFFLIIRRLAALPFQGKDGRHVAMLETFPGSYPSLSSEVQKYSKKDLKRMESRFYQYWSKVRISANAASEYVENFLYSANFSAKISGSALIGLFSFFVRLLMEPRIESTALIVLIFLILIVVFFISLFVFRKYELLWCRRTVTIYKENYYLNKKKNPRVFLKMKQRAK